MKNLLLALALTSTVVSTHALAGCATLYTQNQTSYAQFNHDDQNWGAGWGHEENNPYSGNGYFSGCDGNNPRVPTAFVGEVAFYPVGHEGDSQYECQITFWGNGHVSSFTQPSAGYNCSLASLKNDNDLTLTFSPAKSKR